MGSFVVKLTIPLTVGGVVLSVGDTGLDVLGAVGNSLNQAINGGYVMEVKAERSWKRRFVDRPDITRSTAVKL